MISHVKIVDLIRNEVEDENTRAQVDQIVLLADGSYRVSGAIIKRATRFSKVWIVDVNVKVLEV